MSQQTKKEKKWDNAIFGIVKPVNQISSSKFSTFESYLGKASSFIFKQRSSWGVMQLFCGPSSLVFHWEWSPPPPCIETPGNCCEFVNNYLSLWNKAVIVPLICVYVSSLHLGWIESVYFYCLYSVVKHSWHYAIKNFKCNVSNLLSFLVFVS